MAENDTGKNHQSDRARWVGCPIEADYFGEERKSGKKQRKKLIAADRSKYKKTDVDQQKKTGIPRSPSAERQLAAMRGRVLSIVPQGILVDTGATTGAFLCTLRGTLKQEKLRLKNLVTVGDFVLLEELSQGQGSIIAVEARRSVLSRADNLSRNREQLIAANIDQVIITASVLSPLLKPTLIDRYIIATMKGKMAPLVVINKMDLLDDDSFSEQERLDQRALLDAALQAYKAAGIPVICTSIDDAEKMDALRSAMKGKASVFSGQSGVGKSSLINAVTGEQLRVGKIVGRTGKGSHTTTTAQLLPLEGGGWCIDTPGIQSFGVWDICSSEIEGYFSEIHALGKSCHFPSCSHTHEQGCNVQNSLESGALSPLRYISYVALLESSIEQHRRR